MEGVIFDANGGRAYRFSRGHPPVDYLKAFPTSQLIRTSIALFAVGIANGLLTLPAQEEAKDEEATVAAPWTQTNTRLANHYIKLLQKDPAYGDVLDLLWELYRKKDQTPLLIQYFEKASSQGGEIPALLYAHLLRKNDQIDEAREAYDIVLETNEANPHALRALAEIADLQKRFSKALSLYTRLANQVPAAAEEGIALRLRKAALHRMQGQNEKAVEVWNEILDAHPGREDLRTRIVGQLLEAGETDSALQVLQDLVESGDPRLRLEALTSLTRLYEFISDFDGAVESAVKGLALLHYKNHDYADLFSQLVRIHERFDRLPELEEKLRSAVSEENPTEKALYELAEYYQIVADPTREEAAVVRLVEKLPGEMSYRIRLTHIQMRNDRYEAAAETLESALETQTDYPLHLMLLRAEISLGDEDKVAAEEVVSDYLAKESPNSDAIREIIEFARKNYLDSLVEKLLLKIEENSLAGTDGVSAPLELARFLHERGKKGQSFETLDRFVESVDEASLEKARRYHQVAVAFRELDEIDRAVEAIENAINLAPENKDFQTTRADLLVESGQIDEAVKQLESLWQIGSSYDDRADIDQRLFSLLRGHYSTEDPAVEDDSVLKNGTIQSLAQYRRLAAAASRVNRPGDEPPPKEVTAYYDRIKKAANDKKATGLRYRAAWWALKLQDNQECYIQLTKATEEAGKPVYEVEKMLLELAILNERPTLMVRHLTNLAEIDPANEDEYLQQKAEKRFELGFEDEAIRELKRLAAKPEASLNTLNTLAKVYRSQGSTTKQVDVWRRAYREANVFEKRRIVKQLSTALIENGNPQSALEAQLELLQKESDPVQRRKQLDTQLTTARSHFLLEWLLGEYRDLAQQNPFDKFYPEALARIYRAAGEDREAFEAMKKAYYMSGRNEDLLDELGQLADRLGDLKSAIYYRRQLLAREQGSRLESWQTLIEMLEKDLRVGEASLLRKRLESRFGRDPDFLNDLAKHYLKDGSYIDAERAMSKLVALRNWDLRAKFHLALLKQQRGKSEEALALYSEIIEQTKDAEYPDDLIARAMPLIQLSALDPEYREESGRELEPFIFSVESYPYLGGNLQDDIAEAFQQNHPEFRYLPKSEHLLRLRAIEEAGQIVAKNGTAKQWLEPRLKKTLPLQERLWAARHAEDRTSLAHLIAELPEPETDVEILSHAYCRLLAGDNEKLIKWAEPDSERDGGRHPRSRYVVMAAALLLLDAQRDPLRKEAELFAVLDEMPINQAVGRHLFSQLRKNRDYEAAFRLGELLVESPLEKEGSFHLEVAQAAGWAGHNAERIQHLDSAIRLLGESREVRSPRSFLVALSERVGHFSHDRERVEYIEQLGEDLRGFPRLTEGDLAERQAILALVQNQFPKALNYLREMTNLYLEGMRPNSMDLDEARYDQTQHWQVMDQILRHYSQRIPITPKNRAALLTALSGNNVPLPADETVLAEYEKFEIDRRLLALRVLGEKERDSLVDQLDRSLLEPDSSLELARALESLGYYREAIPVYRAEAMTRDRDYAPLQGLLEACNEALEPGPALTVINQINAREFPTPPGLTSEYLAEQHARFLLLSRDLERLVPLSRPPTPGKNAPPITTKAHLPYQAALIEAYRLMGHNDALLRILTHLKNTGKSESRQLLLGARTLQKEGRLKEAIEWAKDIPLDGSEPALDREAITLTAELLVEAGENPVEELVAIALKSLGQHPTSLTRKLIRVTHEAGGTNEAISLLRLLRRKSSDDRLQTAMTMQLIEMESANGTEPGELAAEWEQLFLRFFYEPNAPDRLSFSPSKYSLNSNAGEFAEKLLQSDLDREALEQVLHSLSAPPKSNWFRDLLTAALRDELEETATTLLSDAGPETAAKILETLPSFGPDGIAAAKSFVSASAKPGVDFFRHQPVRQVTFFHRIGDRERLLEVHQLLMRQAESDIFHQTGLDDWYPTLTTRQELPRLFAEMEEHDLALRLFRRYHEGITSYRWNHQLFLERFVRFLIEKKEFAEAETILKRAFRKSIRVDLRLLPELYAAWGKIDEWEPRTRNLYLSEGRVALLRDWRTALAEGREMVEYSDTW